MKGDRTALILGFALLATPLLAAPKDAIGARNTGYRALGDAFKAANDQLKSGSPKMAVIQASAAKIQAAAKAQYGWFPAGSGPETGLKTLAKPEIWAQPADFKAAQDAFSAQAAAFAKAAASGNATLVSAQARQLGAACKACHTKYRVDPRS